MNKKAQIGIQQIFIIVVAFLFLSALIPEFTKLFNQNCPACDCSAYQNQLADCNQKLANPEIIYVNKTIEVPVVETKIVYLDFPINITFISLSLIISLALTLFSFKIKLPQKMEEKLEELENIITFVKFGSLVLTVIIFIKLLMVLMPLL